MTLRSRSPAQILIAMMAQVLKTRETLLDSCLHSLFSSTVWPNYVAPGLGNTGVSSPTSSEYPSSPWSAGGTKSGWCDVSCPGMRWHKLTPSRCVQVS